MKVLIFTGSMVTGGAQRQALCLARGLVSNGVDTRLVTVMPGGEYWDEARACSGLRVESVFEEPSRWRIWRALSLLSVPARLRAIIREFEPDVVYSMLDLANVFAGLATRRTRCRRLVWGVRSTVRPEGYRAALPFWMSKRMSRTVQTIIANSQRGLDHLVENGFTVNDGRVVYNGIDTERFSFDSEKRHSLREQWQVPTDALAIGLVGRLDVRKGHEDFLGMAAQCAAKRDDLQFICIGPGASDYRNSLEELSRKLGIEDIVKFVGPCSDMSGAYSAVDVLVSSSHGEGFPNVVGEAMACGRAVVVTDVGDSKHLVGDCGRVVSAGNVAALSDAVLDTIEGRASMGECGRRRVEERFSVSAMVSNTLEALLP